MIGTTQEEIEFLVHERDQAKLLLAAAKEEIECYEGMKEGVSVRIADLEAELANTKRERNNTVAMCSQLTLELAAIKNRKFVAGWDAAVATIKSELSLIDWSEVIDKITNDPELIKKSEEQFEEREVKNG